MQGLEQSLSISRKSPESGCLNCAGRGTKRQVKPQGQQHRQSLAQLAGMYRRFFPGAHPPAQFSLLLFGGPPSIHGPWSRDKCGNPLVPMGPIDYKLCSY